MDGRHKAGHDGAGTGVRIVLRAAALVSLALEPPRARPAAATASRASRSPRRPCSRFSSKPSSPQYTLISFERLDGRSGERYGGVFYEMRIRAVLHYDSVKLRCRRPACPELHHYLLEDDARSKKATVAGWLFLEQDGDRWRTVPLTPGPQ